MKVILVLDNENGMLFNHRRQSRDRVLIDKVLETIGASQLWISSFSEELFPFPVITDEAFLDKAASEDYCFVEDKHIEKYADKIDEIVIFYWNRDYPADFYLDFPPEKAGMHMIEREDFVGFSHEKITREVWKK